jgi:hypothetical protein
MDVSFLEPLYRHVGPYVSVYIDTTWRIENAAQIVRLRWRALEEELAAQDVDAATVTAIKDELDFQISRRHPDGLAIFTAGGEAIFSEGLGEPPPAQLARVAPLPHVMPLVAWLGERIPHLIALVGRLGAEIISVAADGDRVKVTVPGEEDYPVRKVSAGDWNQARFQRAAEETWRSNAKKFAREIEAEAHRRGAEVIVLAGDSHARTILMDEVMDIVLDRIVETDRGALAPGADDRMLDAEVHQILRIAAADHVMGALGRFREQIGRRDRAVEGMPVTLEAFRRAQVDTMLIEDRPDSGSALWVGPDPLHIATDPDQLRELGVREPAEDRADAALMRVAVAAGSDVVIVQRGELDAHDGVGAVLRYADPARRDDGLTWR